MTATVFDVARGAKEFTASALEPATEVVKGESFHTKWQLPPTVTIPVPPGDYRDQLPPSVREVAEQYAPVVEKGRWTHGLFDCWAPKIRPLKAAVHIPCWEAYRLDPRKWRGVCFGRTASECWWVGLQYARWARAAWGGMLGEDWRRRGAASEWRSVINEMASFYCCMTVTLDLLLSVGSTCGGSYGMNWMAWYSCPTRATLRQRFQLPPTCGLPEGCDDCCVHFCCMYCASHQELRELAVRGVDAPGMHVLDVTPQSFAHLPGFRKRMAQREAELAAMGAAAYTEYRTEGPARMRPPAEQEMHRGFPDEAFLHEGQRGAPAGM